MAKRGCCLCNNKIGDENAPILTLGNSGWPRYICENCENTISTASLATEYEEIEEACRNLGDGMIAMHVEDAAVIEAVNDIIKTSMERANQIKDGTYDFSLDEVAEEAEESEEGEGGAKAEFDIPEELRETEEDRALDEKEARSNKILDTVTSWLAGLILLGAVIFFLIRFVF